MTGQTFLASYDYRLVILSVLIAVLASYTSFDLAGRVTASRHWARFAWLTAGAASLGIGIWSTHYVGMLAFSLPIPILYDWPTVLLSLLAAVCASAAGLFVVSRQTMGQPRALAGSVFMGGAIVALHYIAMSAMLLGAMCRYSPFLVALSVLVAIAGSWMALWLAFFFRDEAPGRWMRKIASAALMGTAIVSMHYTAMAAASFTPTATPPNLSHAVSISTLGTAAIGGVSVMVLVVTLLTSMVDRLQERKTLLDELFEQAPNAVALVNSYDRVVRINREFAHIFGYAPSEVLGRRLTELIVSEESQDQAYWGSAKRGQRVDKEDVCRRKDGSRLDVAVILAPFSLPGGEAVVYAIYRDITERKLQEEALRGSEREQRQIARHLEIERTLLIQAQMVANVGSWVAEFPSLNLIWSERIHRIFETDPTCFHPTRPKFREFIHPEDRAKVDAAFASSLNDRSPGTVEYRIVMPDGRVKIIEERWQVFHDEQGQPVRLVGACLDISERLLMVEALRELSGQLLRSQDEERRRLARELHDSTGQKLAALAINLSVLDQSTAAADVRAQRALAESLALTDECLREVRTLAYLLHPPELEELGLADAARDYVNGFAQRSGIPVELELSPDLGRLREEVETALFRILQESLNNVHRHSGTSRARVHIHRSPASVTMEVQDEGQGISEGAWRDDRKPVVTPGVGLAGMRERVRQLGGQLEIHSTRRGTSLKVVLPLNGGFHG